MAIPNSQFLAGVLGGANANAAYEPQRSDNGTLTILGLDQLPNAPAGATDAVKLCVANFPLPDVSFNVTEINYLNEKRRYAGKANVGAVSASFHDYVDRQIAETLWAWYTYIQDPLTGIRGIKAKYAKTAYYDLAAPDNNPNQTRTFKVLNIWPTNVNFGQINMQSDEPVLIQASFSIDKVLQYSAGL